MDPAEMAAIRSRLYNHFAVAPDDKQGSKWDELYEVGFMPWDHGTPGPDLVYFLEEKRDVIGESFHHDPAQGRRRKRALVPGCGTGHDVLLLAAYGYDAYGLEISARAIDAAKRAEKVAEEQQMYPAKDASIGRGKVTWLIGDFFNDDFLSVVDGCQVFDLIYDHTFLSALPPSLRPSWSRRHNDLLSPSGHLVCFEFPTTKPVASKGPPWALPPKVYMGHLPRPGEQLSYDDEQGLLENLLGTPSVDGLVRIAHFQPVLPAVDGKIPEVKDWVSVWKHV